jgi:hypothetical protein
MEIDLLVILIVVWGILIGWKRRGLTALMDLMACALVGVILLTIIPVTEGMVLNQVLRKRLIDWVQQHLMNTSPDSAFYFRIYQDIPVGSGMFNRSVLITNELYEYCMVALFGVALFISIQMVRKAFITVWDVRAGLWDSSVMGAGIGGLLAIMLVFFITTIFGLLSWFQGFEWLDQSMVQSIFVRFMSNYNPL